jgi:RHH-type proline utilization regulon transcriptional repressor/proline dehydrogenase/delta 1-pyrroline-5-carboxylate dehydrogenase
MGVIVDLLGEKTITQGDADRYAARVAGLIDDLRGTRGEGRRSIAIKPTALAPRLHPLTADAGLAEARERLVPILQAATDAGLLVWFDMEQFEVKDLTLVLFRSLLGDPALAGARAGIVIQAYLRDSSHDLADLLSWSAERRRPLSVRLVKGAYWDAETVLARAHGWPVPVYEHKGDTDASFERGTRLLLEHRAGPDPTVQPAFASHNVRSIAHAIAVADDLGLPRADLQLQMLYGMEGGLAAAVRSLGPQVDVYAPVGDLVPGMAYLVRRLLENSSNESFVRQTGRQVDEDLLLAPPVTIDDGTGAMVAAGAAAGSGSQAGTGSGAAA